MSVPSDLNRFEYAPTNLDMSRSVFNRNHSVKFSCNVGDCIPFLCDEVLPGDTFSVDTSKVVRLQPLVAPIMDEVVLDTYYFFIPNRLVWNHWKEFMGENNESPWTPETEYSIPQLEIPTGGFDVGTIADYIGIPPYAGAGTKVSALPFRAYARVMDEWFRDENNMNPVHYAMDDNDITGVNTGDQVTDIEKGGKPFVACKLHDYFTSCLPGAQKGTAVSINAGGFAPVYPRDEAIFEFGQTAPDDISDIKFLKYGSVNNKFGSYNYTDTYALGFAGEAATGDSYGHYVQTQSKITSGLGYLNNIPNNLFADLSVSSGVNVNELRQAFAVQKYFEKLARGGSRYVEMVKTMFGVTSPDSRIQRTEYLGGNRVPLNISQVEQTSATEQDLTPQGNVAGMSFTGNVNSDFTKSFTEHGYILGIAVLRYRHTYQDGVERHWNRKTVYDFYNPLFANLGEQAVKNREIFLSTDDDDNESVFGYQEAWAEYRFKPSRVAGEMRSKYTTSLDFYHLADDYATCPTLTDTWIREDKSMLDRCLAVTSAVSNQCICDFYIQNKVARPMPLYSIPGLIDHH